MFIYPGDDLPEETGEPNMQENPQDLLTAILIERERTACRLLHAFVRLAEAKARTGLPETPDSDIDSFFYTVFCPAEREAEKK